MTHQAIADNLLEVINEHDELLKYDPITSAEMAQYLLDHQVCAFFHDYKSCFSSVFFGCNAKGKIKREDRIPFYECRCDMKENKITVHRCVALRINTQRNDIEKSDSARKVVKSGNHPEYVDLKTTYYILKARGLPAKDIVCLHLAEYVAFLEVSELRHRFPVLIYTNAFLFEIKLERRLPTYNEAIVLCDQLATVLENLE